MPIYEYSCQKCGAHLEVMRKITDKPLARHPKCGGKLSKEWSQTSFQLKGSGWYVTDYAGKKQDSKESAEAKTDAAEAKTTEARKTDGGEKSESKVESKAEAKKTSKSSAKAAPSGKD
ncbi:MAG: zinc ribbon domain-containing protein [Acidobacteria bacterium]|nr:zinc ribbon domain-containing protein [Acidobacteriota bacterium]